MPARESLEVPCQRSSYENTTTFNRFMDGFRVANPSLPFTHTSIHPSGKYYLADHASEFFDAYTHALDSEATLSVTERPQKKSTIVRADFDLKFLSNDVTLTKAHFYTREMVKDCVTAYRNAMECLVDANTTVYWHEKKAPRTEGKYVKDGFHIVFPYVSVQQPVLDHIFRKATKEITEADVFGDLPKTVGKICDPISSNPWLMYGSSKAVGQEPYLCTHGFDSDDSPVELPTDPVRFFSIVRKEDTKINPRVSIDAPITKKKKNAHTVDAQGWYTQNKNLFELIMKNMPMIRLDDYHDWIKLIFFCSTHGVPEEVAKEWSRRSSRFDEGGFWRAWNSVDPNREGGVGVGTLIRYLQDGLGVRETTKLISPVSRGWATMDTANERVKKTYEILACKRTAVRFARLFDYFYGEDVVFVSKKTCFQWSETSTLWEQVDAHVIEAHITDSLLPLVEEVIEFLSSLFISFSDSSDRETIKKQQKSYYNILIELEKGCKTSNAIFKYLLGKKIDPKFRQKINRQDHLLSVKNGVVDLRTKKLRPRCREDFMTFCLDTEYRPDRADQTECVDFVKDLMLGSTDLSAYLQKALGYICTGSMKEELMFIFVGEAGAGKGTLLSRMVEVLGSIDEEKDCYVGNHDISVFLRKNRETSDSRSSLARINGKRLVMINEADGETRFDAKLLCSITGQDKITGKFLYENEFSFQPQCKVVVQCNEIPTVNATGAIRRRFVIVPFQAQYRFEGDKTRPYNKENPIHRVADKTLKEKHKSPQGKENWLAYLVDGASRWYDKDDLKENKPQQVETASKEYFTENRDSIEKWFDARVVVGGKEHVKRDVVFSKFMEWNKHHQVRSKAKFYRKIESLGAIPKKVKGIRGFYLTVRDQDFEKED